MIQSNQAVLSSPVPRFRDAYQTLLDEMHAISRTDLLAIDLDIPAAVTTVLSALPRIRSFRPQIVAMTLRYDVHRFDKLEAYTLAVGYANSLYLAASQTSASIDDLGNEAAQLCDLLIAEATTLSQRRLLDEKRLSELKGARELGDLAADLFTLAAMMRKVWPSIVGKTSLRIAEIDLAETLADKLLTALAQREQGPRVAAGTAEIRQRAFTLFVSAYEDTRRVVHFLRWNYGDADSIAPSLYGRVKPRQRDDAMLPSASEPRASPTAEAFRDAPPPAAAVAVARGGAANP
jgi:hypothetical protein